MREYGRQTEDAIEKICRESFLADFVVRSPMYRTATAGDREAADLMLPLRDTLVAEHQVLTADEVDRLKSTYRNIRIQLNHAIIGRFVRQRGPAELRDFREETGLAKFSDPQDFAEILKSQGISELEKVVSCIEVVVAKGAV